ncbi:MAG: cutinase family protein [Corynebacterium sp.]|nr:cutinase family protein [Corynebacterium sp.]
MNKSVRVLGSILAALLMVVGVAPINTSSANADTPIERWYNTATADLVHSTGTGWLFKDYPAVLRGNDVLLSPSQRCGTDLVLIVRGSSEDPWGWDQPDTLTYQQVGDDLWADSPYQLGRRKLTGGGYLGDGAVRANMGIPVATLVYPAQAISFLGGPEVSTDKYRNSVHKGGDQLIAALHHVFDACGDNPPNLILAGYSQGADVINNATARITNTDEQYLMDRVKKIFLLGDPSRRIEGPENTEAWVYGQPTNPVGGVSRAVTQGTPFGLYYPALDEYRDSHAGQIASYCVPGDLVCDTHSGETIQGVEMHTAYGNMITRISKPEIAEKFGYYNNVQYLDAMYAQAMDALGRTPGINVNAIATVGPGLNYMNIAQNIRDVNTSHTVHVRGVAVNGQVFEGVGTIGVGASGAFAYFLPPAAAMALDLEIYLDDQFISRIPAVYSWGTKMDGTNSRVKSAIYVQGDHDYDTTMGELLVSQIQNWNVPIEQRIELIRTAYGDAGVRLYFSWLNLVYAAGIRVEYTDQLNRLMEDGEIPRLNADLNPLIDFLHETGSLDAYGNLNILGFDFVTLLDTVVATT